MNLRRKSVLTIIVVMVALALVLTAITSGLMNNGYDVLERKEVSQNVDRTISTLDSMIDSLNGTGVDWSAWNDTYDYMMGSNPSYIEDQLIDSTFTSLKIDYMMFFDKNGSYVDGRGYDLDKQESIPVLASFIENISNNWKSLSFQSNDDSRGGIIVLPECCLLLAIHPITNNDKSAPSVGSMVIARVLDSSLTRSWGDMLNVTITINSINSDPLPEDFATALPHIVPDGSYVLPQDSDTISGYSSLIDIYGHSALLLKVSIPRDIHSEGVRNVGILVWSMILICLFSTVLIIFMNDRLFFSRITHLTTTVEGIGKEGDVTRRIEIAGNDELHQLAEAMNKTMDALVSLEVQLKESERRYRAIVEDQNEMIIRYDKDGVIKYCNDSAAEVFGSIPHFLIGKNLSMILPRDAYLKHAEHLSKITLQRPFVTEEYSGSGVSAIPSYAAWTIKGIFDEHGNLIEYQSVGRDLSEMKAAEEALRQANNKLELLSSITRHDILNQITVVHGFISLAMRENGHDKVVGHLLKAENAISAIRGHLEFTKDYQKMGGTPPQWRGVSAVIDRAIASAKTDGIEINKQLLGIEIFSDPLIEKVFSSLLDNSIRHGEKVTRISFACRDGQDGSLLITYEDNGVGVASEDKERIFEAGFGKNTGYGLFLAREVLGITGLSIRENGTPGNGVRFEIKVPKGKYRYIP